MDDLILRNPPPEDQRSQSTFDEQTKVIDRECNRDERNRNGQTDTEHDLRDVREGNRGGSVLVWEVSDRYGEDGGDEGHGQEHDRDDGEDHDGLALSTGERGLVSCEPGFKCIGMFLLKVEEVGELRRLAWHSSG